MKIVNRKEFLAMPSGTIYQSLTPNIFGGLEIKYETWTNLNGKPIDFIYASLTGDFATPEGMDWDDVLFDMEENGISVPVSFEETSRDGSFKDDAKYFVWDAQDIKGLIAKLTEYLPEGSK